MRLSPGSVKKRWALHYRQYCALHRKREFHLEICREESLHHMPNRSGSCRYLYIILHLCSCFQSHLKQRDQPNQEWWWLVREWLTRRWSRRQNFTILGRQSSWEGRKIKAITLSKDSSKKRRVAMVRSTTAQASGYAGLDQTCMRMNHSDIEIDELWCWQ